MTSNGQYPRPLRDRERELLSFVLPADRPGYLRYRSLLDLLSVIGEGRRGAGNLILGPAGSRPDPALPPTDVVAFGAVETTRDTLTISVHEAFAEQIDVEIVGTRGEQVPDHFEERRRWTYSDWAPGMHSPSSGEPVREVMIGQSAVLALSADERRVWVHDATTGINRLLPLTGLYNELMLLKHIRDPKTALTPSLLFVDLAMYTDDDLMAAFLALNAERHRIDVVAGEAVQPPRPRGAFLKRLFPRRF